VAVVLALLWLASGVAVGVAGLAAIGSLLLGLIRATLDE